MWRILLLTLISVVPATAGAQRNLTVAGEQRVALVIGNSAYKEAQLANPVNDASDIAKALQQFGFKVILKRNAGARDMRQAIREFGAELRRAQVGLFYFAGHGVQLKGDNYLIPVGADIESEAEAEDLAINANLVLRTMEEAQVKVGILILDACRNNPFARSFRSSARGLAQMNAATGSVIAFATAPGSVAADGTGRNGTYTKHLLASLNQPNTDILKVFQRTRASVVKETGGRQTPWESTSLVGDFYFRAPAAGVPTSAAVSLELALWESVKESRNPEELNAYLAQYPKGLFAEVARARLKALSAAPIPTSSPPQEVALVAPPSVVSPPPAAPGASFRDCDVCPEMVMIPPGSFLMGSPNSEPGRSFDEGPQRSVTIPRSFAAGKHEVTFDEWDACVRDRGCSHSPSDFGWGRGRRPVMEVSWNDAKDYVAWLSRKTSKTYRLLTEAEWEYVARAGTTTAFWFGNSISPQQANYNSSVSYAGGATGTKQGKTVAVGSYPANAFGLHDVHGNVMEWVEDCQNVNYVGAPSDGSAWVGGGCAKRVFRGGSFGNDPQSLRSADRVGTVPTERNIGLGLRVARTN